MAKQGFYSRYSDAFTFAKLKIPPGILLALSIIASIVIFVLCFLFYDVTLGILIALVVCDIGVGLPFFLAQRRIDTIERRLPDVLQHISITLKTGGTVETALKEVTRIDYGAITDGLKTVLRELEEGKAFEDAFRDFAIASHSPLLEKAAVIIIAARRSGGGLLDTLSAMSEDIRAVYRLKSERRSKTFMHYLFILSAGCFIAPFVFGILRSVIAILSRLGTAGVSGGGTIVMFELLFKSYVMLEALLSVFGAVQVRDGNLSRGFILAPLMVVLAYVIYMVVAVMFLGVLGIR